MDNGKPPDRIKDGGGTNNLATRLALANTAKTSAALMQQLSAHYAITTIACNVWACHKKCTKHLAHSTEKMCDGLVNNAYQH